MRNVNGLLLSALVMFAVVIVQLTNISVDTGTNDQPTDISVDFEVTDAHAQFEGVGCGSCPQLATDADVRLCKKQNNCNKPKPAPVVEPVVDPVPEVKPAKKPAKKRGKRTSEPVDPCGNGTCDEDETFDTCPADCLCGNGTCDEGEMTCEGDCCVSTGECDTSGFVKCDLLGSNIPIPPDPIVAMQICEDTGGRIVIVPAIGSCEQFTEDELTTPVFVKEEKSRLVSFVGDDILIVIILLVLILIFVVVPRLMKKDEDETPEDGKGEKPSSGAPGVRQLVTAFICVPDNYVGYRG